MIANINEILVEWAYRTKDGKPNPKSMAHQIILEGILREFGWNIEQRGELLRNLQEAPEKKLDPEREKLMKKVIKYKDEKGDDAEITVGGAIKQGEDHLAYQKAKQMLGDEESGGKEDDAGKLSGKSAEFDRTSDVNTQADTTDDGKDKDGAGEEDSKEKDDETGEEERAPNKPVTQDEIDEIDGKHKTNALNGKEKVPGTKSSATNEIGTGYAMACLDEAPDDVDNCLDTKLKDTKFGKSASNNSKTKRKHMIRAARREKRRVNETIKREKMNSDSTTVSHIGGTKGSLNRTVTHLEEKRVDEVNGIPFDASDPSKLYKGKMVDGVFVPEKDNDGNKIALPVEYDDDGKPRNYAQIILNGGGGGDPTDTLVVMVDESQDPPKVAINHTSNKMTTKDIQSNSGPTTTVKNNTEAAKKGLAKEDHEKADKIQVATLVEIELQRKSQKDYVRGYTPRLSDLADDPAVLDKIYDRLMNGLDGNPAGISETPGKYAIIALKKAGCDPDLVKNPNANKPKIRQCIKKYLNELKDKKKPLTGEEDQIVTRLLTEEAMITGKTPKDDPMTRTKLNSFYEKQTEALNTQREDLNELGRNQDPPNPRLGDDVFIDDLIGRMHLDIAEGHNPGGIPNENFELIHGSYEGTAIRQDSDGNLYEKGDDGKYYKLDKDGKPTGDGVKQNKLEKFDCSVVGNPEVHRDCLGLKDGEDIKEGFDVTYDEYKMEDGTISIKAVIYDRKRKVIAVQTVRSKSGPGGQIQDEMKWGNEYQDCMAKATKKLGLCE